MSTTMAVRSGTRGAPALIGIDWGSSTFRAALLDAGGEMLERRERPEGVLATPAAGHASTLWRACGDWVTRHRVPLIASGMIGSRNGLAEVPYLPCPVGVEALAQALARVELQVPDEHGGGRAIALHIVPGLITGSAREGWDVVRGEETQLLGVRRDPARLYVLPGTHAKWMRRTDDGLIASFGTYMTGELFEVLVRHASLGRVMADSVWSPQAFERGVREARDARLEDLLFRVRTAGLTGLMAASELADYLSGMLIGAELAAGIERFDARSVGAPIGLLGSPLLTRRYALAMTSFGLAARELPGDLVFEGLAAIARHARLIDTP